MESTIVRLDTGHSQIAYLIITGKGLDDRDRINSTQSYDEFFSRKPKSDITKLRENDAVLFSSDGENRATFQ